MSDEDWHSYCWFVSEEQSVLYVDGETNAVVRPGCAGGDYLEFVKTAPIQPRTFYMAHNEKR